MPLTVSLLETGAVYSYGKIPPGTANHITGFVITVFNAFVDLVHSLGPVSTYEINDMVLDNWGLVDLWIAEEKITSYGPSGIGFVNVGVVNELTVNAPIETFGGTGESLVKGVILTLAAVALSDKHGELRFMAA